MVLEKQHPLSRRERQIMDVLIAQGRASASDIQSLIPDPPGYSAIRATLRVMEEKGYIRHEQNGPAYVYAPKIAPERAKRSALKHILNTFFAGSAERMVAALLDVSSGNLDPSELDRIAALVEEARREGR
jgi:BlaI family transcriptional regulator, penicillinase repressor